MENKQLSAPAEAPNPVGTDHCAENYTNYTPNTGAQHIARLIAGEQVVETSNLPAPWGELAKIITAQRNGRSAVDLFEELIADREDANELRSAVLAVKIDQDTASLESESGAQELSLVTPAPELPEDANLPQGWMTGLDEIGSWLSKYNAFGCMASPMSPPLFHTILGLTLLSTAIARRVYVRVANTNLYPNIYSLIVAHSTLYAKTTALEIARRVLQMADLERLMLPVGITPQSLIGELTNRQPDTFSTWELGDQDDWRSERKFAAQRVWLMDEAAGLLDAFDQKHMAELLNQVLRLFDCPDKMVAASTIARGRQTIREAYLTVCGPTTPAAMRTHLNNRSHWGNGLFARFAFVTPDTPPQHVFYPPEIEIPTSLIDPLRSLALERLPMPKDIYVGENQSIEALWAQLAPGVFERWKTYHRGLWHIIRSQVIPEKLYPSYGRFHTLAMKIAMQLATVDWAEMPGSGTIIVSMLHWTKAQLLAEQLRASLHRMIADASRVSEDDDLEAKVIRLLRKAARGLSTRELAIGLSMTESARRDIVDHLVERMRRDRLIELTERRGTRGPAAQAWILTSKT